MICRKGAHAGQTGQQGERQPSKFKPGGTKVNLSKVTDCSDVSK